VRVPALIAQSLDPVITQQTSVPLALIDQQRWVIGTLTFEIAIAAIGEGGTSVGDGLTKDAPDAIDDLGKSIGTESLTRLFGVEPHPKQRLVGVHIA
jgi:hypothetical protein